MHKARPGRAAGPRQGGGRATPDAALLAAARLTELGKPKTADREVLLHGDFYLGNVLVHAGHVSALIDFEFSRALTPIWKREAGRPTRCTPCGA